MSDARMRSKVMWRHLHRHCVILKIMEFPTPLIFLYRDVNTPVTAAEYLAYL